MQNGIGIFLYRCGTDNRRGGRGLWMGSWCGGKDRVDGCDCEGEQRVSPHGQLATTTEQ